MKEEEIKDLSDQEVDPVQRKRQMLINTVLVHQHKTFNSLKYCTCHQTNLPFCSPYIDLFPSLHWLMCYGVPVACVKHYTVYDNVYIVKFYSDPSPPYTCKPCGSGRGEGAKSEELLYRLGELTMTRGGTMVED